MKSMKIVKNKKFHCNFSLMLFVIFMVQRKNDDITTFYELVNFDGLVKSPSYRLRWLGKKFEIQGVPLKGV